MSTLNELWTQTQSSESTGSYKELPDGEYQCLINDVELRESKSGNTGISWDFLVQNSNRHIFKWSRLPSNPPQAFQESVKWLKRDLQTLDLQCESFDALESTLKMAIGMFVKVEIVTKDNQYRNIYIVEKIEKALKQNQSPQVDDDVPF
jgi:hypothetical protein